MKERTEKQSNDILYRKGILINKVSDVISLLPRIDLVKSDNHYTHILVIGWFTIRVIIGLKK